MQNVVVDIPAMSGRAVRLAAGDTLRVIDVEGLQVADLVAYVADNPIEHFSQGFTRMLNDSVTVGVGDYLYSSLSNPLLQLTHDPVGAHDMYYPPCNTTYYERVLGITDKTGCREHLTAALTDFGIGFQAVTDPFYVFMNTYIDPDGHPVIALPKSGAGDYIELRAVTDLIVAVSACAAHIGDCNGGNCTPIRLVVNPV